MSLTGVCRCTTEPPESSVPIHSPLTWQIFARKVLHLFIFNGSQVLENELRVIKKLCQHGHKNIIQVLDYGNISGQTYGFIDMELCDLNLEEFNRCQWKRIEATHRLPAGSLELETWNIMSQIADGLAFMHRQREVHRDLKPRNGNREIGNVC